MLRETRLSDVNYQVRFELDNHLLKCGLGRGLPLYQVPSSCLATTDMGRKLGAVPPVGAGFPSNTMSLGSRSTFVSNGILIHPAVCPQQTWTDNWGLCPFWGGRTGPASNTMWPGPRPTSLPSFVLIHPTVWSQETNVADRTCIQIGHRHATV